MSVARAAGTVIERAHDDHRPRTFVFSDLHLQRGGGGPWAQLTNVLTEARVDAASTRVLILGDLFDSWVGPAQMDVDGWREGMALFADATAAGVSVTVLHGNRDFMLDDAFAARTGCRVVPGGLRCRLGGVDTLALHGDELCTNDVPYQRAKRLLRSPFTKGLLRALPIGWALRSAEKARSQSEATIQRGDQTRFLPTRTAVQSAFDVGVSRLIFGHVHRAAHDSWGSDGQEYHVLPAFDQAGGHLFVDAERFERRDASGRIESVPPPHPMA